MTTEEFNRSLDLKLAQIADAKFLLTSVSEAHARQVKRIFEKGEKVGGKIGQYNSENPIYVAPDKSPKKFTTKGKNGETTFKSGKPHKTGYFDSYKAFRGEIGRETSFVNLRLTENLKFDFTNSLVLSGGFYVTGTRRKENSDKAEGIVDKYGNVFKLTAEEVKIYSDSVKRKLTEWLNK